MSVIQNDLEPHITSFKQHVVEVALVVGIGVGMCVFVRVRRLLEIQDQDAQDNVNRAGNFSFFTRAVVATATVAAVGTGLVLWRYT
jgi:hypothetical protein